MIAKWVQEPKGGHLVFLEGDESVVIADCDCPETAQFVAAAPDLLESLEPFVVFNSSEETITITVRTEDVRKARAAIAKATGSAA